MALSKGQKAREEALGLSGRLWPCGAARPSTVEEAAFLSSTKQSEHLGRGAFRPIWGDRICLLASFTISVPDTNALMAE